MELGALIKTIIVVTLVLDFFINDNSLIVRIIGGLSWFWDNFIGPAIILVFIAAVIFITFVMFS